MGHDSVLEQIVMASLLHSEGLINDGQKRLEEGFTLEKEVEIPS
ncbi:MAG: hypothetical protein AAGJ81_13010 [Verrucomicrobiota bacterium]